MPRNWQTSLAYTAPTRFHRCSEWHGITMTPRTPVVPPGMIQPVFYSAKRLTLSRRLCRTYGKLLLSHGQPAFIRHGGPRPHLLHRPEPPRTAVGNYRSFRSIWTYSSRIRLESDMPLRSDRLDITLDQIPLRSVFFNRITYLLHLLFRNI